MVGGSVEEAVKQRKRLSCALSVDSRLPRVL